MVLTEKFGDVNAETLVREGIIERIRDPITGSDMHPRLPWKKIGNVTIAAGYISIFTDEEKIRRPSHRLTIAFRGLAKQWDFVIRMPGENLPGGELPSGGIATVAGTQVGLAPLTETQLCIAQTLLMQSVDRGIEHSERFMRHQPILPRI